MKRPEFFWIAVVGALLLFFVNAYIGMYLGFGVKHYWFTESLHLLGGFFVAMFFYGFSDSTNRIFFLVLLTAILWELTEYLVDTVPLLSNYIKDFLRLKSTAITPGDTLLDLVLGIVGATLFLCCAGSRRTKVL